MINKFSNPQDLSIQYLIDQGKELEDLVLFGARPKTQEIIDFLDKIYYLANHTKYLDDFELALDLLQKWRSILLTFYNENYLKIVSRSPNSFSWEASNPFISAEKHQMLEKADPDYSKRKKLRNLALGRVSQSKLEDVTKQVEAKENVSLVPPLSQEEKARLLKLSFFPKSVK